MQVLVAGETFELERRSLGDVGTCRAIFLRGFPATTGIGQSASKLGPERAELASNRLAQIARLTIELGGAVECHGASRRISRNQVVIPGRRQVAGTVEVHGQRVRACLTSGLKGQREAMMAALANAWCRAR